MAHHDNNENLSPEEKKFRELMQNGDDFLKIEIYRSAIHKYREAAKMHIDDATAQKKVEECHVLLQKENKAIYIILAVAAVIVAIVCMAN